MTELTEDDLVRYVRTFYDAYRERFHELAPDEDPPLPRLAQEELDLVLVNGGRALHFFFTDPDEPKPSRVTRVHDVLLWPPSTSELKALAEEQPGQHREQVRRTADIEGTLYVHFVVYPEDGAVAEILAEVAWRVAEREVARGRGEVLADEVPGQTLGGNGADDDVTRPDPTRDWIQPGP